MKILYLFFMIQNEIQNILDPHIASGKKLSTKLTINFWKKNYDIDKIYL